LSCDQGRIASGMLTVKISTDVFIFKILEVPESYKKLMDIRKFENVEEISCTIFQNLTILMKILLSLKTNLNYIRNFLGNFNKFDETLGISRVYLQPSPLFLEFLKFRQNF
jgi:arabinogalactan endo-1,4-beta-galactosidase